MIEQRCPRRTRGAKRIGRSAAATPTTSRASASTAASRACASTAASRACASTAASRASASTAGSPAGWCCESPSDRGRPAPSSERALDDSHPFRPSSCRRPPPERVAARTSIPVAFMAWAVASLRRRRALLGRQGGRPSWRRFSDRLDKPGHTRPETAHAWHPANAVPIENSLRRRDLRR
jgi:hypothetical protein